MPKVRKERLKCEKFFFKMQNFQLHIREGWKKTISYSLPIEASGSHTLLKRNKKWEVPRALRRSFTSSFLTPSVLWGVYTPSNTHVPADQPSQSRGYHSSTDVWLWYQSMVSASSRKGDTPSGFIQCNFKGNTLFLRINGLSGLTRRGKPFLLMRTLDVDITLLETCSGTAGNRLK